MRILLNFQLCDNAWSVHCIADDLRTRTPVSSFVPIPSVELLVRLLRYVGASEAGIEKAMSDIDLCSRGSVPITLTPGRRNLLRIRAPWNAGLVEP